MKVMHIISGGEVGGSRVHLLSLVSNSECDEHIIICLMDGKLYREAIEMGLDIRLIEQKNRFDLKVVDDIVRICKEEEVRLVNCHGARANFLAYFLRQKLKVPFVTTIHSDYMKDYEGNFFKTLVFSNINKMVLRYFDYYIAVSDEFKKMLVERRFDENRIFVVYNGIDFNNVLLKSNRKNILKKYKIRNDSKIITMVARLHPIKGHKFLFDAIKLVLKEYDDVVFLLIGDGSFKSELLNYSKELNILHRLRFLGFHKPDEYLAVSNFTVLTSQSESFPLSILEAAKYKKTVVATDVGGVSKLIEDGVNGYLVNYGEVEELAEKILSLLRDDLKCQQFGQRLHEKAKENYSVEKFAKQYRDIYVKIEGAGRTGNGR
ncbi:Alpha-D-kanosaminyltransferase [Caloramator mitchellensis]|uniref:Alpha-D-kanosaminyltransferase n=1 Tax=Caloramator mitchellensis TaxID=908809 RepID=A0A0R3K3D1_CALMK|nr:glycosyltransferase family 4 protein [Caloramator mitchellensis]KRQ87442.1 Alpha-D-kanosaminyltransferase [Caloramator mitchellensis]